MSLAKDLIKVKNLQIASKLVSEQVTLGLHTSKRSGLGVEFEQYKHYTPGDDPSKIDWKLYARTNKHQVKISATESTLLLNFVLDLSGSMNYTENAVARLEYAKILLASMAYLGYKQGDFMNLFGLKNSKLEPLVLQGKQTFQRILYTLENAKASGPLSFETLPDFGGKQKELLIWATDLLQIDEEMLQLIKKWAKPGKEILIFQILGENEVNLNLKGMKRFVDLETGKSVELDAESIRKEYQQNISAYLKNIEKELLIPHVHLQKCMLNQPIAEVIKEALKKVKWN